MSAACGDLMPEVNGLGAGRRRGLGGRPRDRWLGEIKVLPTQAVIIPPDLVFLYALHGGGRLRPPPGSSLVDFSLLQFSILVLAIILRPSIFIVPIL